MTNEELIIAGKKWGALKRAYGKEPFEGEVTMAAKCFKNYTLEELDDAMSEYLIIGKFAPTIADIVEIIDKRHGRDVASLEIAADKWFNNFLSNFNSHCDMVTIDERAVAAFYIAFGSLTHFGQLSNAAEAVEKHKASFRRVYVNVSETDIKAAGNVIYAEGPYTYGNTVQLLGNRKEAKALLPKLYPEGVKINNDPDRVKRVEPPKEEPTTREDALRAMKALDDILEQFKGMLR